MGWRELHAWVAEHNRSVQRRIDAQTTDAGSWRNGRDQWWQEQDRRRREHR